MFTAVALQTRIYGCRSRDDINKNLEAILSAIDGLKFTASMEAPLKLVALSEGALQGFYDEITDMPHIRYCEKVAITIPGKETEVLAEKAREHSIYIIAQAKSLEPDVIPDRFFNTSFIISPEGKVIHKHHKTRVFVHEHSTTPFDVWSAWVKKFGGDVKNLYPVAKTDIGNIGTIICYEGRFPETARALALNGAEIIYRTAQAEPWTGYGYFELQNRARALDNCCFVISPNLGPYYQTVESRNPSYVGGGNSMIVNYRGQVLSQVRHPQEGYACAMINIDELREYRCASMMGLLPHISEEWGEIYWGANFWPKDIYLKRPPGGHQEAEKRYQKAVDRLIRRGVFVSPKKGG